MDFLFGLTPGDLIYDIETYPNIFSIGIHHATTDKRWLFEISSRRNDLQLFCKFINVAACNNNRMVGFNNIGFDYPVIHFIIQNQLVGITVENIYNKAMSIINGARFSSIVWPSDWKVDQLDLFKIHHFDNKAKSTSLKMLEFNMRLDDIEDLPFKPGTVLTEQEMETLVTYMWDDINATFEFYKESLDAINFREELTEKYDHNFMNHNDTKIGKDFLIMKLEEAKPGCCYDHSPGKKKIQQTPRESINLGDVILPYVSFEHPEFKRIHNWFNLKTITETKGSIKDLNCSVRGFQFVFGTGGIHGSVESQIVYSDDEFIIDDRDVTSFYPSLAIVNKMYPEHLGETFCKIYEEVFQERRKHAKGTAENKSLKLALNGTYGDSNNKYSPFYDPKFTMAITINGQLSLCMLAEKLMRLDSLQMIQANTDGITLRYPRIYKEWVDSVCTWWEQLTGLMLEHAEYSMMAIRDVNNYIAKYTNGKVKLKGAYLYDRSWHQNHSALVVPKAAEAALVHGIDIEEFIMNHDDIFDFFLRAKVPRSNILTWGGKEVQNIVRYYISTDGDFLEKTMPAAGPIGEYKRANKLTDAYFNEIMTEIGPGVWDERIHTKNKSKYEDRVSDIESGQTVQLCNNLPAEISRDQFTIDYNWYINKAKNLVDPLIK